MQATQTPERLLGPQTAPGPWTDQSRRIRIAHIATVDLSLRMLLFAQLKGLRDEGFDVTAISSPGPWVSELEAEGIRHVAWRNATRSIDAAADARAFAELVRTLRRERFDLVHTHTAKAGVMGRIAARLAGTPCVVNTVHGFDARPDDPLRKRALFMGLEWVAARFSDLELYQSTRDQQRAHRIRLAAPPKSVHLGNGVDLARFDPDAVATERVRDLRRRLGIADDAVVVGTVGRLVIDKGYGELIAAARVVHDRVPSTRFVAIGEADTHNRGTLGPAELAGAGDHFLFLGWQDDVPALLAMMDIFVLPSWREGMPRAAMEAAAMARPLVLTDIPGCHEIARDRVEALFVPPRDPERLADAILELLADPILRARLGRCARETARERFDEGRIAQRVVDRSLALLTAKGLAPRAPVPVR